MKYRHREIVVPKWVSCRTYLFGEVESRTYISNEKSHTYFLLEGLSSDMWELIFNNVSELEFDSWTEKNGVSDQAENFIEQLIDNELLLVVGHKEEEITQFTYAEMSEQDNQESEFIEEMENWLFEKGFMFSLFFELTYRCNLKCVHCYNPKDMASVELDYEQCKKAIDDAYEVGCFKVVFSGGESSLYSHFYDVVEYARNKHMSVEIFTNGQLLYDDEKLYNAIMALYPYRICVSLYGVDKNSHESVTAVDGSFNKTFYLIKKLRKDNVNVQIKNFLLNTNCFECIKVKNFAKDLKATSVADISLIPTIEGDKKTLQYMLDEDTLFKLFTDKESPLFLDIDKYKPKEIDKIKGDSPCSGGFSGICINPRGEVVICVSMPLVIGNLNNSSIKEIWGQALEKNPNSILYQWQQITLKDFEECFKEDFCKFCQLCPGMCYLENGYLKKSNVLCTQAKARMKAYNFLTAKKQ